MSDYCTKRNKDELIWLREKPTEIDDQSEALLHIVRHRSALRWNIAIYKRAHSTFLAERRKERKGKLHISNLTLTAMAEAQLKVPTQ